MEHHSLVAESQQFGFCIEHRNRRMHCNHPKHPNHSQRSQLSIEEPLGRKFGFQSIRKDRKYDQEQRLGEFDDDEIGLQEQDWLAYKIQSIHSSLPSPGAHSLGRKG
jgi:hypothetical protein